MALDFNNSNKLLNKHSSDFVFPISIYKTCIQKKNIILIKLSILNLMNNIFN